MTDRTRVDINVVHVDPIPEGVIDSNGACFPQKGLPWRRTENERDDSISGNFDVLERTQDMDFPVKNIQNSFNGRYKCNE